MVMARRRQGREGKGMMGWLTAWKKQGYITQTGGSKNGWAAMAAITYSRLAGCRGAAVARLAQQEAPLPASAGATLVQEQAPGWQQQAPPEAAQRQGEVEAAQQEAARPPPLPAAAPVAASKSMVRLLGTGGRSSVGF